MMMLGLNEKADLSIDLTSSKMSDEEDKNTWNAALVATIVATSQNDRNLSTPLAEWGLT